MEAFRILHGTRKHPGATMRAGIVMMGCVSVCGCFATPYQKFGMRGGYSDEQVEPGVFRVSFRGNGFTDAEKVKLFLQYRCAEVTLQNGYRYFVPVVGGSAPLAATVAIPMGGGWSTSQRLGGGTAARAIIRTFKERPNEPPQAYDAQEVLTTLRPQVLK